MRILGTAVRDGQGHSVRTVLFHIEHTAAAAVGHLEHMAVQVEGHISRY